MSHTDTLILLLTVSLVAGLALWQWQPAEHAAGAVVWLDGEAIHHLDLSRDTRLSVQGPIGTTAVQVHAGRIRVTESPGPRQICVRAGWLQSPGDTAVCLPNRVIVEVTGEDPRFDAINQ